METILVTGGCGFIGSNFIIHLINKNKNVKIINLDKLTYAGNAKNLSLVNKDNYSLIKGDICDRKLLKSLFHKYEFNSIVHFAAESHVDRSIDNPSQFINTNIFGTYNLLECSTEYFLDKKNDNFRFLHVSTDEVFGSLGDEGRFTEDSPYDPSSPYSASKASSDHLVRAWHRTYGLPILLTNCSNNYGPFQFPEKLIPLMIINALNEKPLPIYGNGENIRDWLYVMDHCDGIYSVLLKGKNGDTYNIGGDNEIKNKDVVKTICNILDKIKPRKNNESYLNLIKYVSDRPGHDFRYAIDATKIKSEIQWAPSETFESGIHKTIQWYIENPDWWRSILDNTYMQERLGII